MLDLVPLPLSSTLGEEFLDTSKGFCIVMDSENTATSDIASPRVRVAFLLDEWLSKTSGQPVPMCKNHIESRALIKIELKADTNASPWHFELGSDESYTLSIKTTGILLGANTYAGLVHGAATLYQLALSNPDKLQVCEIIDKPRFAWRGFMLDCARHFFPVSFVLKVIDLLAIHKLNVFHWHLSDDQAWRLDIPGMPELVKHGSRRKDSRINGDSWIEGYYSLEDVKTVIEYAAARAVMVQPEFETPGHVTALLAAHPELACNNADGSKQFLPEDRYGIFEDVLCVGSERSIKLVERIVNQIAVMFPSKFIHMGGDEVPKTRWMACPDCLKTMQEHGFRKNGSLDPEALHAYFMRNLAVILSKLGKRMIVWDEATDFGLPKDTLIYAWQNFARASLALKSGHSVVMCPQTKACYLDHKHLDSPAEPGNLGVCTVRNTYSLEPPQLESDELVAEKLFGVQANLWAEMIGFSRQAEYMMFPRLCALSEVAWSPKSARDFASFKKRMKAHGMRLDRLDVARFRGAMDEGEAAGIQQ